jgi:hypothetical protein
MQLMILGSKGGADADGIGDGSVSLGQLHSFPDAAGQPADDL